MPFKGPRLASCVASETTEIQGPCQVCRATCGGPKTPSRTSDTNLDCLFDGNAHLFDAANIGRARPPLQPLCDFVTKTNVIFLTVSCFIVTFFVFKRNNKKQAELKYLCGGYQALFKGSRWHNMAPSYLLDSRTALSLWTGVSWKGSKNFDVESTLQVWISLKWIEINCLSSTENLEYLWLFIKEKSLLVFEWQLFEKRVPKTSF